MPPVIFAMIRTRKIDNVGDRGAIFVIVGPDLASKHGISGKR